MDIQNQFVGLIGAAICGLMASLLVGLELAKGDWVEWKSSGMANIFGFTNTWKEFSWEKFFSTFTGWVVLLLSVIALLSLCLGLYASSNLKRKKGAG